jgi:hypothetical protein
MPLKRGDHAMPGQGEHVIKPIEPADRPALHMVGEGFTKSAEAFLNGGHFIVVEYSGAKTFLAARNEAVRIAGQAGEYSLGLNRYWTHMRHVADDTYTYNKSADRTWLDTNEFLRDLDSTLERQLKTWDEVTSPYSEYDPGRILNAASALRTTIEGAMDKTKPAPKSTGPDAIFNKRISSALAGLSEQIGARLNALGGGKTVERVTMSGQTRELLERNGTDVVAEKIATEASELQGLRDEFVKNNYTADGLERMWVRQGEIQEKLGDSTLSAPERQKLEAEGGRIGKALEAFEAANRFGQKVAGRRDADTLRPR